MGCCVDALVGPFCARQEGVQRRKRARLSGIVLSSAPDGKWKVYWTSIGKASLVSGRTLRFSKKADASSMGGMEISALTNREFLGEQPGLDAWFLTEAGGLLTGLGSDGAARGGDSIMVARNGSRVGGLLTVADSGLCFY